MIVFAGMFELCFWMFELCLDVWCMAIVLILASGCVWNYFCVGASSQRGQQKPEENLVAGWRQACRAVAHGATTCACRATHLGAIVLDSIYSRSVNHHQVCHASPDGAAR
jgi:hypothetical protein